MSSIVAFQLIDCLYPMIHRDLQERNMLTTRIKWGHEEHRPSFWPDDIAPWGYICNPVHPQKYQFPVSITDILKIAVYRCLTAKGIDPREYVREDVCHKQIRNKLRNRSLKTLDEAYQRFYSLFLFKSEPEEVKHTPEETLDNRDYQQSAPKSEEVETFEYSDDDIMSDDEEENGDNDPEDDRAAAISNILNILAND